MKISSGKSKKSGSLVYRLKTAENTHFESNIVANKKLVKITAKATRVK